MRGRAFPPDTTWEREPSHEYGTPISNVDDIPIDPALGGAPIDPALMAEDSGMNVVQIQPEPYPYQQPPPQEQDEYERIHQYAQGPQGDPFAPQQTAPYFPIMEEAPAPLPKPKRRRKIKREEECSFCQGNDAKNKVGELEQMVTCSECGRSGHPSCMDLSEIGDHLRSYPWKCMECKNCEICQEKGDDERILFCDWCDRGWHLDCMNPPMDAAPEGDWHCPMCSPLLPDEQISFQPEDFQQLPPPQTPTIRGSSIASSSQAMHRNTQSQPRDKKKGTFKSRGGGKGKGRGRPTIATDDSESEEVDVEMEATPVVSRPRGRPKSSKKGKGKQKRPVVKEEVGEEEEEMEMVEEEEGEEEGQPSSPPLRQPKRKRRRDSTPPVHYPRVRLLPPQKSKGKEREEDEPRGLFDDILKPEERDTAKTTITTQDKDKFERSRAIAEEKLAPPPPPPRTAASTTSEAEISIAGPSRPLRSSTLNHSSSFISTKYNAPSASPVPSTPGPISKAEPPGLRIRTIRFGQYDIKTWYDAPFPEEYANIPDGRMWICEFCLKYMKSKFGAGRHRLKCKVKHPPGDEIYRDGSVSIFEVDGRRNKIYCQNLCLLSKMFLDHKSLFYDVEPFLFYVITEVDDVGARFVGYFSKEKRSPKDYNVSCIMTLPVRQRQGWGNLLIDFSYLLSKKEQRAGSPEKPLSSLGALGYRNYWTLALMRYLETAPDNVRLEDISAATSMTIEDICETLIQQSMIYMREATPPPVRPSPGQSIKFPKGRKNGVARRQLQRMQTNDSVDGPKGPFLPPKYYEIRFNREKVCNYMRAWEAKGYLRLRPEKLQWTPYLVSRNNKPEGADAIETPAMSGALNGSDKPQYANGATAQLLSGESTESPDPESATTATNPDLARVSESWMVDSPAALFDDEMDELPTVVSKPTRSVRSRTMSPVKKSSRKNGSPLRDVQPDDTPKRRLRGRSSQATTVSTPTREAPVVEETSVSRRKRGRPSRTSSRLNNVIDLEDDEALATKLALEESRQGRQLRSRPSETHLEHRRTNSAAGTSPKVTPARKRRRLESSAELEEASIEDVQTPIEEATSPNGIHVNGDASAQSESQANGAPTVKADERDIKAVAETVLDSGAEMQTIEVVEPPAMRSEPVAAQEVPGKTDLLRDPDIELDVKSEDVGTPLTSMTSRQSVPSDDTIFGTEMMHDKPPNGIAGINGHMESDPKSILGAGAGEAGAPVRMYVNGFDETEYGDDDADGEYEEDAEGEPDEEMLEMSNTTPVVISSTPGSFGFLRGSLVAWTRSEQTMQYGHMPMPDRRDSNLDSNGSTPFQTHPSLGQALGNHMNGPVGPGPAYSRAETYRNLSTSPPSIPQPGGQSQGHAAASSSHSPLTYTVNPGQASPAMKRKQMGDNVVQGTSVMKRRRDADEGDSFDIDGNAQGAKHWTDEEKTKLFNWLMGHGQDDHWNSLRATKNSCLRECAIEVFGSKKTYQALKGCYERNFNLFKQIYAFETYHAHAGSPNISQLAEAERVREYERRLQTARKNGCDVGNITARTIDHWHRMGWYKLFFMRWNGDPATTRPVQQRGSGNGAPNTGLGDEPDLDDDAPMDFNDHNPMPNGLNGMSHTFLPPPPLLRDAPPISASPAIMPAPGPSTITAPTPVPGGDAPVVNLTVTQNMLSTYLQFLQMQTQTNKMKLEYMRRREEREEKESVLRREFERQKMERDSAELDRQKRAAEVKQKVDKAIELMGNPNADSGVKQAASDYLKKLFLD
ncbi:hypothetical protein BDQ12DRAFT_711658 [Crucibulum laeve]|uniref:Histone acetyltransferase n=1 Tax=Crucibulum laeve TaxID=68775 RepID=A0A5C3M6F9_9AGAR|nr:hypothetical protein BDQ12DRAFT_711658 [Crucibulum laeve]